MILLYYMVPGTTCYSLYRYCIILAYDTRLYRCICSILFGMVMLKRALQNVDTTGPCMTNSPLK